MTGVKGRGHGDGERPKRFPKKLYETELLGLQGELVQMHRDPRLPAR